MAATYLNLNRFTFTSYTPTYLSLMMTC